jgi:hypothetical protein
MIVELSAEWEPKYSEKTCLVPFCPPQKPTWPELHSNPGPSGGKPAANRPSYGAAYITISRMRVASSCMFCVAAWRIGCVSVRLQLKAVRGPNDGCCGASTILPLDGLLAYTARAHSQYSLTKDHTPPLTQRPSWKVDISSAACCRLHLWIPRDHYHSHRKPP